MSSCNDYAEFLATLCLETGARPHLVAPLARRLRRLATTHQRHAVVRCNGCTRCDGWNGYNRWHPPTHPLPTDQEKGETLRERCRECGFEAVEAAIETTRATLASLGAETNGTPHTGTPHTKWAAIFQHDPRGATVRLRLPSGLGYEGAIVVPTSGRV